MLLCNTLNTLVGIMTHLPKKLAESARWTTAVLQQCHCRTSTLHGKETLLLVECLVVFLQAGPTISKASQIISLHAVR